MIPAPRLCPKHRRFEITPSDRARGMIRGVVRTSRQDKEIDRARRIRIFEKHRWRRSTILPKSIRKRSEIASVEHEKSGCRGDRKERFEGPSMISSSLKV